MKACSHRAGSRRCSVRGSWYRRTRIAWAIASKGRQSVDADELKAALHHDPFVELHPSDAERLGLTDGATARLRTETGEATLPVRVSDGITSGSAFVPWNQKGLRANALFAATAVAGVTVEAAEPAEAAAGEGG
jgi:anaerobic selenocysteine-containing dehydrogenase